MKRLLPSLRDWQKYEADLLEAFRYQPFEDSLEGVYTMLGQHKLLMFAVDEGFFIVGPEIDEGQLVLLVYMAYGNGVNLTKKYENDIIEIARSIKANKFIFYSTRKAWRKFYKYVGNKFYKEWDNVG